MYIFWKIQIWSYNCCLKFNSFPLTIKLLNKFLNETQKIISYSSPYFLLLVPHMHPPLSETNMKSFKGPWNFNTTTLYIMLFLSGMSYYCLCLGKFHLILQDSSQIPQIQRSISCLKQLNAPTSCFHCISHNFQL